MEPLCKLTLTSRTGGLRTHKQGICAYAVRTAEELGRHRHTGERTFKRALCMQAAGLRIRSQESRRTGPTQARGREDSQVS